MDKKDRNQVDMCYNILSLCVQNPWTTKGEILKQFGISESDNVYKTLQSNKFVNINGHNLEILPNGYSAYLSITSFRQSDSNAEKAINNSDKQFKKSIRFATWALIISLASFLASIGFSIYSIMCN